MRTRHRNATLPGEEPEEIMALPDHVAACYICTFALCEQVGGRTLLEGLRARLAGSGCRVKAYLCFGSCATGPNIVLMPQGTWYNAVQLTDIDDIAAHIRGGEPVARLVREVDADTLRSALWMTDDDFDEQ